MGDWIVYLLAERGSHNRMLRKTMRVFGSLEQCAAHCEYKDSWTSCYKFVNGVPSPANKELEQLCKEHRDAQ